MSSSFLSSSTAWSSRAVLIVVFALLYLLVPVAPVAAEPFGAAVPSVVFAFSASDLVSNRALAVQAAIVIIAVGVFLLTRTYR